MKKKLLVVAVGSDAGGVERSLIDFLRFLDTTNLFEIDLCLWRKPGVLYAQIPHSVKVINKCLAAMILRDVKEHCRFWDKIDYLYRYTLYRIFRALGKQTYAFKRINKKYDVAVSYNHHDISPYYVIDCVKANKKIMWYHHGAYEYDSKQRHIHEHYFAQFDKLVAVSDSCREMLGEVFPSLRPKMVVVRNLVDWQNILKKAELPLGYEKNKEVNIVTVARLSKFKGQMLALEAAKLLSKQGVGFIWYFVGGGSEQDEQRCRVYIDENGLTERCILVGETSNPYSYMQMADVYVQPSLVESEGLTIKEAKLLRKMIVATDIPAIRENLQDGRFGLLCNPTAESLAEGVYRIIMDNQLRDRLKKHLNEQGDFNAFNKQSEEIILSVLA